MNTMWPITAMNMGIVKRSKTVTIRDVGPDLDYRRDSLQSEHVMT